MQVQLAMHIEAMSLRASPAQCQQLAQFIALLAKWNKVYNLTAIRDVNAMLSEHVLDSLSLTPYVKGPRVLDVGTGGGLPGIPLAILLPDIEFSLLDSNAKKTRYVQQAVIELKINNIDVISSRAEEYQPDVLPAQITSRAFSSLVDFATAVRHLSNDGTELLAMKGKYPADELDALNGANVEVIKLDVPTISAERHLVRFSALSDLGAANA